ncbi:MAG: hypothetical protein ACTHXA_04255 [Gulosibacter sp.]|uniref:hypothetical protein n=1 Tax=Gulosibacter sp. TaxID=2817531 RepID=UPI003F915078
MGEESALIGFIAFGLVLVGIGLVIVLLMTPFAKHLPASIVAQYVPPEGDIIEHGLAVRADRRVLAAAIINLAVQDKIRVLAPREAKGPVAIEARLGKAISPEERFLLQALRPPLRGQKRSQRYLRALAEIGIQVRSVEEAPDVYFLKGRGAFRGHQRRALAEYFDHARERVKQDGIARKVTFSVHLYVLSLLFLAVLVVSAILILYAFLEGEWVGAVVASVTSLALFWVLTLSPPPMLWFTEHGRALRQYLSGVRDYIRLGEQDRLRMLQSPQGALRTPAGGLTPGGVALGLPAQPTAGDPVAQSSLDRFLLTERLLPYAVLFRLENKWEDEFERLGTSSVTPQNLRALGSTLEGVMTVLQVLLIIGQLLRVVGSTLSIFGRGD